MKHETWISFILFLAFFSTSLFAKDATNNALHLLKSEVDLLKGSYSCAPSMIIGGSGKRKHICADTSSNSRIFAESYKGRVVTVTEQTESFGLDFETFLAELELPLGCSKNSTRQNSLVYECPDKEFVIVNFVENEFLFETEYCLLNFCKSNLSF